MSYRPKLTTGHDANHFMVRDFLMVLPGYEAVKIGADVVYLAQLHGYRVGAIDTCRLGGPWLDWFCFAEWVGCLVEVKTPEAIKAPGKSLRPGELWTVTNLPFHTTVLSTDEEVQALYDILLSDIMRGNPRSSRGIKGQ